LQPEFGRQNLGSKPPSIVQGLLFVPQPHISWHISNGLEQEAGIAPRLLQFSRIAT
jgi:hypothetical protein